MDLCTTIGKNQDIHDKLCEINEHVSAFWKLFPSDMDCEIEKINEVTQNENKKRKERYQRVHHEINKQEYIIFHALIIGASAYAEQGDRLWSDDKSGFGMKKKKEKCLQIR